MPITSALREGRAATSQPGHHFFGYYDKFPWDATGRYMLALEVDFIDRPPTPDDIARVVLIDLESGDDIVPPQAEMIAETRAWNWQQGTMLQWLGSAPDRKIVYNTREGDHFAAVVHDVRSGEKRTLPRAIYALSPDGKQAVVPNYARTAVTRPGYGYVGLPDPGHDRLHPDDDGIYCMDMETGENRLIITLDQIVNIRHNETMPQGKHWFNHLQFNTDGTRFLFLHRWKNERSWFTRMFTSNPDGSGVVCVADHDMISHFDWRDPDTILAWATQHDRGNHYYLFDQATGECETMGEDVLTCDGHCSYSPDRRWVLTDTYPDAERNRTLILYRPEDNQRVDTGKFFSPQEIDGEIRCDLHPRWSRDRKQVCLDSVHEGHRQMYVVDVSDIV